MLNAGLRRFSMIGQTFVKRAIRRNALQFIFGPIMKRARYADIQFAM
jgi:hypothetical protein